MINVTVWNVCISSPNERIAFVSSPFLWYNARVTNVWQELSILEKISFFYGSFCPQRYCRSGGCGLLVHDGKREYRGGIRDLSRCIPRCIADPMARVTLADRPADQAASACGRHRMQPHERTHRAHARGYHRLQPQRDADGGGYLHLGARARGHDAELAARTCGKR